MKDEFKGIPINKCIGLKSKINCIVSNDYTEVNTEKRVNISTEFNEYEDFLLNEKKSDTKWKEFKVKKHKIGTYDVNKISLSCFDDKRYILNDEITTLAYFHKDLGD